MGRLILLLGGARSGKSTLAERMAKELGGDQVLFVATAQAGDDEMRARIAAHQQARPAGWRTLEAPLQVAEQLRRVDDPLPPVIVLDCITLLASNVLLALPDECSTADATSAVLGEIDALLSFQQSTAATWIVVTNEVGMGVVPPYRLGRLYRDALGAANQKLAQAADEVLLLVAGLPWRLR
jgi:adenosylcobinamide kinase/adenosylcobinamide-phosphate guanylyltransferase